MNTLVGTADVERFRDIVGRRLGLHFEDDQTDLLGAALRRRLDELRCSSGSYLNRLAIGALSTEIGPLATELTNNETSFFRNVEQFVALAEIVVPDRRRVRAARRQLRMLSVGCASGEEAYTLAMVVRTHLPDPSWDTSIIGIDIDPAALRKAVNARYSPRALRSTPAQMRARWFHPDDDELLLDERIRRSVRFVERNLAVDDPELWRPDTYDAILCRNVLMYLTADAARTVVSRLIRSLAPGGYLFLGHAETLRGVSDAMQVRRTHGTFYYQRAERSEYRPEPGVPAAPTATACRELALDLLQGERYIEALRVLEAIPQEQTGHRDMLVLYAVLLTHAGRLDRAEEVCRRLLELDGADARAHYLLASCREMLGDARGAADHNSAAAAFDPGFAMPRLRLGLLARQRGDHATARRELGRALALLSREEPQRVLLFGGGFSRDSLIAMCRAELVTCGGTQ